MKIGILGYGKEGKSAEQYFKTHKHDVTVFDDFTNDSLKNEKLADFDLILRSPSVHPQPNFSSMTRFFFDHCPCPIIGVTGTKGKGTTCTIITSLLKNLGRNVYLVGNIGNPSIDILDKLTPNDVVVYEMSSFQLWDLDKSPHISVITNLEPDHLNVHDDFEDYTNAKANICKHQTSSDFCIYFKNNPNTAKIASSSPAQKIAYPSDNAEIINITKHLSLPGQHNRNNAEAAILVAASYLGLPVSEFLEQHHDTIIKTLQNIRSLPHRLEFLCEINGVKYYDDNFSTTPTSLKVALKSFPGQDIVLIVGGRDKTNNADLPEIIDLIKTYPAKVVLIGESGHAIAKTLTQTNLPDTELANILETATDNRFFLASNLPAAVTMAKNLAGEIQAHYKNTQSAVVLMSPAAASFDMFENVYARGAEFQKLIQEL